MVIERSAVQICGVCVAFLAFCLPAGSQMEQSGLPAVETLLGRLSSLHDQNFSAKLKSSEKKTYPSVQKDLEESADFAVLAGKGRMKYDGTSTYTREQNRRFQQARSKGYAASFSDRPFPGPTGLGGAGYGSIIADANDLYFTEVRFGNWLLGYDMYMKDGDLAARLSQAPPERLSVSKLQNDEGKLLIQLDADLDVGTYRLLFDPEVDLNMVQMSVHRNVKVHTGIPKDYGYPSADLTVSDIRYELIDGRLFPISGRAELNGILSNGVFTGPVHNIATVEFSEVRLLGEMPDDAFHVDWPANSVIYDELSGVSWLVNQQKQRVPLVGSTAEDVEEMLKPLIETVKADISTERRSVQAEDVDAVGSGTAAAPGKSAGLLAAISTPAQAALWWCSVGAVVVSGGLLVVFLLKRKMARKTAFSEPMAPTEDRER